MKKEMLKMAGVHSESAFYKKFPDEKSFMKVHGKEFKKALRGARIKAQAGDTTPYNQQNAGMNAIATGESQVQDAVANLSTGTPKKTVGQTVEGLTSDIPIVGDLVKNVVGIFDASNEAKQQKRAGELSDLQVKAATSQPRPQNRKYNRPDLDANVDDINSLAPAQGTGSNLLAREGTIIPSNMEYAPLTDEDRIKAYYYGGGIPKADAGSIISSILGSSGGSGGGGILSGLLGGNKTTTDTTTMDPSRQVIRYVQAQDGTTTTGITTTIKGPSWIGQVLQGQNVNNSLIKNPTVANNVSQIGQTLQTGVSSLSDNKMSSAIGGLGNTVGSIIPLPGASEALGIAGSLIGDTITNNMGGTKAMARVQRNNDQLSTISASKLMQSNQNKYMRTGGNLRQNYSPDMENNGELSTLWGGHAEPLSYNPYSPNGGETIMFRGNSHEEGNNGRTGIGVRYGDNQPLRPYQDGGQTDANVEVEKDEPAMQMPDNAGNQNLVVFGDLPIPNQFVKQLGDPDAKGKKFKNYVADLSKQEDKQNKLIKNTNLQLKDLNPNTQFDKLKFNTLSLALNGANDKLKDLAEKKKNAANLQQAINDTAEEQGIDADALARGNVKQAKKGAKVTKAQGGTNLGFLEDNADTLNSSGYAPNDTTIVSSGKPTQDQIVGTNANKQRPASYPPVNKLPDFGDLPQMSRENYSTLSGLFQKAQSTKNNSDILAFQQAYHKLAPDYSKRIDSAYPKMASKNEDGIMGERTIQYGQSLQQPDIQSMKQPAEQLLPIDSPQVVPPSKIDNSQSKKQIPQYFNPMGNYLPSNKEDLDPSQLTGEYYALATNNLEPVPAQQYHPNLLTPYEISMQDILNENTAATRGAQRMMGYNPAAQSNLIAQQYAANSKVLGDQFRINQEEKDKIYGQNTNTLNDAQLKNLGILDQQYTRQAQALSNTKRTAEDSLSSISAKYLQNKKDNDTNAIYQNLYNYRYDRNGHAWNMNGPANFNMQGNGVADQSGFASMPEDAKNAYYYDWKEKEVKKAADAAAKAKTGKNGAILKAMRNI